jgi:hypothetical protein
MMFKGSGFAFAAACAVGAATPAIAGFTNVGDPYPGEKSHAEIFGLVYGGTFVADGNNFSNGSLTAERVDDADDILFAASGPTVDSRAIASYADFDQQFGYIDGGGFNELLDLGGYGTNVTGESSDSIDGVFKFARNGLEGILASSDPSDNSDGKDHLVTYVLSGEGIQSNVLVLFFEDKANFDFDYQDLVVEVTGVDASIIPTPAAFGAGLVMLGASVLRRRSRA